MENSKDKGVTTFGCYDNVDESSNRGRKQLIDEHEDTWKSLLD